MPLRCGLPSFYRRDAEGAFEKEYGAVKKIQSAFRGWIVRTHLAEFEYVRYRLRYDPAAQSLMSFACSYYAREIQRVYRGHAGRKLIRILLDRTFEAQRQAVRHYAADVIQRHFRGYYSRRTKHDFYARRAYILAVTAKGEALRAELESAFAAQLQSHLEKEESKHREDFDNLTRSLHHLVSTKAIPGVYNPPYATSLQDVPSAFNIPLETHLRMGVLRELRTTGLYPSSRTQALQATLTSQPKLAMTEIIDPQTGQLRAPTPTAAALASAGLGAAPLAAVGHRNVVLVPSYVSSEKRSLQASMPYDAVLEATRKERRHSKYRNLDQKPFVAGSKVEIIGSMPGIGVNAAEPFLEEHIRARMTREMEPLTGRHLRASAAPYIPASSRASRLFEDTERRRVAQASALIASVTATRPGSGGQPGRTVSAGAFSGRTGQAPLTSSSIATKGTLTLTPSGSAAAMRAGTASTAVSLGVSPTRTMRQGHLVAAVRPATDGNDSGLTGTAKTSSAISAAGVAAGSAVAAARRARIGVPPAAAPTLAGQGTQGGGAPSSAGIASAPTAPASAASTLLLSRSGSASPFIVTVTRAGDATVSSGSGSTARALKGLDANGLLVQQPGSTAAVPGPNKKLSRPLMKPPQAVQAQLAAMAASKPARLRAAVGANELVRPDGAPTAVELEDHV